MTEYSATGASPNRGSDDETTQEDPNRPNPMKGMRGVMSGTLILEMIVVLLALTVIARLDGGARFDFPRVAYVVGLAVAMFLLCGMQKRPWALAANFVVGVVLPIAGWWVHSSLGIVGILFGMVWLYIFYVRAEVKKRMLAGTLPSIEVRGE